jgi:hypothetical protein
MTPHEAATRPGQVCWVDAAYDRANASDGVSRYGAYLRGHPEAFAPFHGPGAGGITLDAGEFAAAALRVATGPIMSPGYVGWHPRVLDHTVGHGQDPEPDRLVCGVTLATSLPRWLGAPWRGWTQYLGRDWVEPGDDRHAALARLELRWPVPVASLPRPGTPATPGEPNLRDATAAVAALVAQVNATAGPVLARLEGGQG